MSRNILFRGYGEILEIIVRDGTGAKIDSRKCQGKDEKEWSNILKWLWEKYGIPSNVSYNLKLEKEEEDNDILKF